MPGPVGGWDAVSPLAKMPEDRAILLDNWFPQPGYVEVRRGFDQFATGMGSSTVETLMVYNGNTSATTKLFACANANIYDITSGTPSASVSSLSNNRWQYTNFTTPAGKYLWCCNGADAPRTFDGTSWATPSLTVSTFTANDIVQVVPHKKRLWVVFNNSTVAGYLGTQAISGTVANFDMGSLVKRGGYLVALGTWTIDGGDGVDDKLVAIFSTGQVAVFIGTDPASDSTWQVEGVYELGAPIGRRCFSQIGGDLILINIDGVLPLSRALGQDRSDAPQIAMTARINQAMNTAARLYKANFGWELVTYPRGTMAILNVPVSYGVEQHQYVMNMLTGAWARFKGQNANCWIVYKDDLYFGGNGGIVYKADTGSTDYTSPITAQMRTAFSYFGAPGRLKLFGMIQPLLTTSSAQRPSIGISTDYKDNASLATPTGTANYAALYGSAIWDSDVYAPDYLSVSDWTGLSGTGQCASIHFNTIKGDAGAYSRPDDVIIQLNGFHLTYQLGGFL